MAVNQEVTAICIYTASESFHNTVLLTLNKWYDPVPSV